MYSVDFSSVEHIKDDWDVSFIGIHSDDRDVCVKEFLENGFLGRDDLLFEG